MRNLKEMTIQELEREIFHLKHFMPTENLLPIYKELAKKRKARREMV
ncbi:hypothetical protein X915_gp043 [Bacillus phage vB_BanS-Tsamsa]|uniref:Uncharacterized protein n=1 Tax=Bacillus phage vB_BanS-Tsamsa TaxID=1308863 RepID=U5JA12_9CAUD|nr:hypothetical protein X915_gp043 [Bacillus phage vB_BanS-Tsamsa]AGI11980.1 hypothetical protein [Bacillus phage vB_BanS-Tsamsa]